jgi:hypothetical protein
MSDVTVPGHHAGRGDDVRTLNHGGADGQHGGQQDPQFAVAVLHAIDRQQGDAYQCDQECRVTSPEGRREHDQQHQVGNREEANVKQPRRFTWIESPRGSARYKYFASSLRTTGILAKLR